MKRFIVYGLLWVLVAVLFTSCATQRDCQGVKHTRLKNGIYL
jgi:predicted small secreted protein